MARSKTWGGEHGREEKGSVKHWTLGKEKGVEKNWLICGFSRKNKKGNTSIRKKRKQRKKRGVRTPSADEDYDVERFEENCSFYKLRERD